MKNNNNSNRSDSKVIAICVFLLFTILFMDSLIPLGVAGGVPYILIVLISLWSPRKQLPIYMAIAGSTFTIFGFFLSPAGGELWKVLTNRSLALFAIWVVAFLSVQRRTMHEENEKALLEIKKLSGLLPICAHCKKIRDDKGYWSNLEAYIEKHSEALFSHGICLECSDKLYGNQDWYIKMKKKKEQKK